MLLQVVEREGLEDFEKTLAVQNNLLEAKITDPTLPDYLILVEHQSVYTVGRSVEKQDIQTESIRDSEGNKVKWIEIGRGGKATFHGPGQLVAYPIFDLTQHGKDVHVFLRKLEQAGIDFLAEFSITATTRAGLTGIWVKNLANEWKKIGSIGIGVKKWISYHGIAINFSTDLSYFKNISPCDQSGQVMTSLEELFDEQNLPLPSFAEFKLKFIRALAKEFIFDVDMPVPKQEVKRAERPEWLRVKASASNHFNQTNDIVRKLSLVTVCEEAKCPNIGECWSHHTATFMIMGELCTRRCSFCAVRDGSLENLQPLDPLEPYKVGKAISELGLKHVVITSVNRDDVPDMGADHFDKTIKAIRKQNPDCQIELLIPDMRGDLELVKTILQSGFVTVLNHNVETVPRLYKSVRPGAKFSRSLAILGHAKNLHPQVKTKSGVMVGLGEEPEEVLEVMDRLREVGVEILTIGQYLQPTDKQLPIARYVTPAEFETYKIEGLKRGFTYVESGPLVRSSYHAWQHTGNVEVPYLEANSSQF